MNKFGEHLIPDIGCGPSARRRLQSPDSPRKGLDGDRHAILSAHRDPDRLVKGTQWPDNAIDPCDAIAWHHTDDRLRYISAYRPSRSMSSSWEPTSLMSPSFMKMILSALRMVKSL